MTDKTTQFPGIKDVPASLWEKLSQKKIYFGHQSVGYNIIEGIKDLMKENPQIKLNIMETIDPNDFSSSGIFAHSSVGRNMDPESKNNGFIDALEKGAGDKAGIAFFKYCYIDFDSSSNPDEVFDRYKESISRLKSKFPGIDIVHFTVPLVSKPRNIKDWLKKILGRSIQDPEGNVRRNEYNELLRKEYGGRDPVFDLAAIESTHPDGGRESFEKDGRFYYSLVPEYTPDGGHLNETGRRRVAEQLLVFLANLN